MTAISRGKINNSRKGGNMSIICSLCGGEYSPSYSSQDCPHCGKMFLEDIEAGRIPKGLTNKSFTFQDWIDFRLYEQKVAQEGIDLEEAKKEIARRVKQLKDRYEKRVAREEEMKRQIASLSKEAMRSRYLY